jgi:hypothetical protein
MRGGRFILLIVLLAVLCPQGALAPSLLSIRLLTLSIGGKTFSYENLAPDSLVEVEVQPAKEVQAVVILEIERDRMIRVWTGLSNALFSWEGCEVVNKNGSSVALRSLENKLVVKVYGTYNQTYESTILFISINGLTPLLIIRSKALEGGLKGEEGSEADKILSKLGEMLSRAQLPASRKEYYENAVLRAQIAAMRGDVGGALEILGRALDELRSEQLESKEVTVLIESANATLMVNKAKLPPQRAADAESKIKLAALKWESGDYGEAKKLANEAKDLATWSTWDEAVAWFTRFTPFIIGSVVLILLAFILLHFRKAKGKVEKPALPREVYTE